MSFLPDQYIDLLKDETRAYASLATLMKDGSPQVTVVWFNTDGEHILVNSAKGRVKDHNMRKRPQVAVLVLDPKNPYRFVQIRGRVIDFTETGGREHIDALNLKYRGTPKYPGGPDEVRVIFKILPEHVTARG